MFKSILLVDDSEIDLLVHSKIIEMAHITQQTVALTSPLRALEYLRSFRNGRSLHPEPDLIFLDINMPCMDGFQFLDELEASLPGESVRPCVVMLTSSMDERDVVRARNYWSVLRFINKPLTIEALEQLRLHAMRWPMAGLSAHSAA